MAAAPLQLQPPSLVHPGDDLGGSLRRIVTERLRAVLERPQVRLTVVAVMLVASSLLALVQAPIGIDSGWIFIIPVAVSAIAAGLAEGLLVALIAAALCGFHSGLSEGMDLTLVGGIASARFALFGLTAAFLGAFAEAHHAVRLNLHRLAMTDPLTRVANVSSFYGFMASLERERTSFAIVVVDIDDLKQLNDTRGHQTGSAAIQLVAEALQGAVRSSDQVARFGGDEFVVVLRDVDAAAAQGVIDRVREILAREMLNSAPGVTVKVSAGSALYGRDGTSVEELLAAADAAMYSDKRAHKQRAIVLA